MFTGVRVIIRSLRSQGNQHFFHIISHLINNIVENLYNATLYLFDHLKPLFNTKALSFPQKVTITVEN